ILGFGSDLSQTPQVSVSAAASASAAAAASIKTVVIRFADADVDADTAVDYCSFYVATADFIGVNRRMRRSDVASNAASCVNETNKS
ncbi:unnamed protein product, partial [Brassica rapa]